MSMCRKRRRGDDGFTLLELLLAVAILSAVTAVTFFAFSTVATAWRKGQAMSDELQHGDFVMEQLVTSLRSAYFLDGPTCGFRLEDEGDDAHSSDKISWVKMGAGLVGNNCPFAGSAHRVEFSIEQDEEGLDAVTIRPWRLRGQADDFDPEKLDPIYISRGITGFNCRPRDPEEAETVEWIDEWKDTNRIPLAVEITLYMEPLKEGEDAVEIKRIVEIPVASRSWGRAALAGGAAARPPEAGQPGAPAISSPGRRPILPVPALPPIGGQPR